MSKLGSSLSMWYSRARGLLSLACVTCMVSCGGTLDAVATRDVLFDIVTHCVDPAAVDYCARCRWPRSDSSCARTDDCARSTEVWALTERFVAIRDVKMCGCPTGYIHGLALPRSRVTGLEDPQRPRDIWKFAWDVARQRMEAPDIALVVNPAGRRTQDQLHVHLVKLRPGLAPSRQRNLVGYVRDLDDVWETADRGARTRGLDDHGVLVSRDADGRFAVIVTAGSPETEFTEWRCR